MRGWVLQARHSMPHRPDADALPAIDLRTLLQQSKRESGSHRPRAPMHVQHADAIRRLSPTAPATKLGSTSSVLNPPPTQRSSEFDRIHTTANTIGMTDAQVNSIRIIFVPVQHKLTGLQHSSTIAGHFDIFFTFVSQSLCARAFVERHRLPNCKSMVNTHT